MDWIKKHLDTFSIIGSLLGAMTWINCCFREVHDRMNQIDNRLTKIETVLIIKNICPPELYGKNENKVN